MVPFQQELQVEQELQHQFQVHQQLMLVGVVLVHLQQDP
tara:strand:+ start:334 stop:450 length:117 start_codon:yes stop_codon:yes gene_type:complete